MSLLERFEGKYTPIPESGCWLWEGVTIRGYGKIRTTSNPSDSLEQAHRVSWKLHKGIIPDGLFVCHKCDVRSCVNPEHLFLGTAKDNMQDAARKGRLNWDSKANPRNLPSGEDHHQSKLTASQVVAIRKSPLNGVDAAKEYGVSANTISRIRSRKIWRKVP